MFGWLNCLWTTIWATNAATPSGWVGLIVGAVIGIALSFQPVFRFPNKPYLDTRLGKVVVVICTFVGMLAGELARVAWAGVCH